MGCAGSKPHLLLSSSLGDHHNHPAVAAANSPQKGHILFNAKTIHYLSHNESHVKAKLVQRCELKLAKELASSTSSAETMSDAKRVRRLASVTLAVDQVIKHAQSDFDADSWKSSNQLYIRQMRKDIMRQHSSSSLHFLTTATAAAATTSTDTISSSSSPQSASMQRTSSSSSASNKDEAAFYKRAMRTAIYEFGSFIQENFTRINGFDEASNNNHNNEKENASSATATATAAAAAAEEAATSLATVDKQVSEMGDAERPMSDALAKIQPVAATASSPAPLLTLQVEKDKAVTESSVAVAGVEVEAEEEATSEEKRRETRGSNWLVGLISCFFLMTWAFSVFSRGALFSQATMTIHAVGTECACQSPLRLLHLSGLNNNNNNNVDCRQRVCSLDTLVVSESNLSSVELSAPLRWIKRGNEMPLHVSVSPLGFASAPHLRYEWSTSDEQLATLHHPLASHTAPAELDQSSSVRLVAHRVGTLKLSVRVHDTTTPEAYFDAYTVVYVFDEAASFILSASNATRHELVGISSGSEFQVRTNLDKHAHKIAYELPYFAPTNTTTAAHNSDQCDNDTLSVSTCSLLCESPSTTSSSASSPIGDVKLSSSINTTSYYVVAYTIIVISAALAIIYSVIVWVCAKNHKKKRNRKVYTQNAEYAWDRNGPDSRLRPPRD